MRLVKPSGIVAAVMTTTLLVAALAVARRLDPLPAGLHGSYFSTIDWSPAPVRSTVDPQPSTASLVAAWDGQPPQTFSTTWSGSLFTLHEGNYTFATASDDGSSVYVDGRLIVDTGGGHGRQSATGTTHLTRGAHNIFITYHRGGESFRFELSWALDGRPFEPVPGWALATRSASFPRFLVSVVLRRSLPAAEWLWVATLVLATVASGWRALAGRHACGRDRASRALVAIVTASVALNLTGLWWDLPGHGWAPDELTPRDVWVALSKHFSHGWFNRYPPFHYYTLTAVYSPLMLLEHLGLVDLSSDVMRVTMIVVGRFVSVLAGMGTLVAIYVCGTHAFSKHAGLFAAAAFALVAPFVYYSKTVNLDVPYLFWFSVSLVFYLRLLRTLRISDFVLFAACATLAICTKDQAYALYLAAPIVIVHRMWRANRELGLSRPLAGTLVDTRLAAAAATASAVFAVCHNLLFNFRGFVDHVRYISGGYTGGYRVFEPTLSGRLQLLALTAHLDQLSLGWPLFLVSVSGFVAAMADTKTRPAAVSLALLVTSYYLGFIDVILYNYDRFLMPVCVVQALFAGFALDRFLASAEHRSRTQRWRMVAVSAMFAYTLLYAGTVDVLMLRDSRHTVERWLSGHVGPDEFVATAFPVEVLPRLDGFQSVDIGTIDDLKRVAPAFYVLNADYARAVPLEAPTGRLITGLRDSTLGYTLAFRYRTPPPWSWLPAAHRDLVGPRLETMVFSTLRGINPTIEIYQRNPS